MAILEAQLAQAKLIAEEADKKYEEVTTNRAQLQSSSLSLYLVVASSTFLCTFSTRLVLNTGWCRLKH